MIFEREDRRELLSGGGTPQFHKCVLPVCHRQDTGKDLVPGILKKYAIRYIQI